MNTLFRSSKESSEESMESDLTPTIHTKAAQLETSAGFAIAGSKNILA